MFCPSFALSSALSLKRAQGKPGVMGPVQRRSAGVGPRGARRKDQAWTPGHSCWGLRSNLMFEQSIAGFDLESEVALFHKFKLLSGNPISLRLLLIRSLRMDLRQQVSSPKWSRLFQLSQYSRFLERRSYCYLVLLPRWKQAKLRCWPRAAVLKSGRLARIVQPRLGPISLPCACECQAQPPKFRKLAL